MNKNLISVAVGSACLVTATTILAVPFNSFDPKSMAMGGAGVAVANPATASYFNPALLSITDKSDDFALELPILGARISDPDNFLDAIDEFDDQVINDLDTAINNYNFSPGSSGPVIAAIDAVNAEVLTLSDKPFGFEGGAGVVIGIPSESFGMAFSATGTAYFSGVLNYEDSATVANLTQDLTTLDGCYAGLPADFTSCISGASFTFVDTNPASSTFGNVIFTAEAGTGTESDIQSKVRFLGIAMAEVGLTFSREMYVFGHEMAVGITPKMVSVTVFDYEASADNADTDNLDAKDYTVDYSDFNLDIGVAKDYGNGWRSGLVVKNLIGQDYDAMRTDPVTGIQTATGTTVSLNPQARVGISHMNEWSTVAVDLDVTENEALDGLGDKSRYLALGAEFNAFSIAQLRVGYRADMVNSNRNIASAGIGLSPFGVHIDLAVAGNQDEVGASFQLGFRF